MAVGPFQQLQFHVSDGGDQPSARLAHSYAMRAGGGDPPMSRIGNDEAAARYYLDRLMAADDRPIMRGIVAEDRPNLASDLRFHGVLEQPLTGTRLVSFEQTRASVPVFGSKATVELDEESRLCSVSARVAEVGRVSPVPSIDERRALEGVARFVGAEAGALVAGPAKPAELAYYFDPGHDRWHLAMHLRDVPLAPPTAEARSDVRPRGIGRSPGEFAPLYDYLVDAHSGEVVYFFSTVRTLVKCRGVDGLGVLQHFNGDAVPGGGFELHDPFRRLKTYDLGRADLTAPFPDHPVRNPDAQFPDPAAVSAHVNAGRVYDFYNGVLKRKGVDGKGMELVSVVNCTYSEHGPPPEWHNAVWWDNRMWYGQVSDGNGGFLSYSRHLDVIGHELTHGVTQALANLVYKDQSGAIDESFSDIFGAIIKNWYVVGAASPASDWDWEIGAGLGAGGLPLRDLSDPTRTGDPDHMDGFVETIADHGGVHTNSNVHNKAAYLLFTSKDACGRPQFSTEDLAVLYYLSLPRLGVLATFDDVLAALLQVAKTYYLGEPDKAGVKVSAITSAYASVGIHPAE
jgi:bacillolysin